MSMSTCTRTAIAAGLTAVAVLVGGCTGSPSESASQPQADTAAAAIAPAGPVSPTEGITVTGVGRASGRPDLLVVTLGVSVTSPTVQEALDGANEAADAVLQVLDERGVAEDDIQTRDFSIHPQYEYPENQPERIVGYAVNNLVEVKIRQIEEAGGLLDAAAAAAGDAARVHGVRFEIEDTDALAAQARDQAFADARVRAEQYAEAAGRALGALVSVSEVSAPSPGPVFEDQAAAPAQRDADVAISPGTQEVAVHVTAVWQLN
ncbi:MAG TPA: SIMPL domain-containing protein [Egibacteraceae bacterium]|nr:SIMPL domain-containing protein [Egibacteraceae bacterium]